MASTKGTHMAMPKLFTTKNSRTTYDECSLWSQSTPLSKQRIFHKHTWLSTMHNYHIRLRISECHYFCGRSLKLGVSGWRPSGIGLCETWWQILKDADYWMVGLIADASRIYTVLYTARTGSLCRGSDFFTFHGEKEGKRTHIATPKLFTTAKLTSDVQWMFSIGVKSKESSINIRGYCQKWKKSLCRSFCGWR